MTVAFQNRPVSPLAKKTVWLVVGESTARTVRIVIAIVLVKLLPVLEWNAVALALTIYLAALTIGSLNLEQSVLYFLPKLSEFDERRLFAQTVAFLMGIAVLIAAVCSVLLSHLEVLRGTGASVFVPIAIAAELCTVTSVPFFISQGQEFKAGMWDLVFGILQFLGLSIPAGMGWGVHGVLAGLAVSSVLRLFVFLFIFGADIARFLDVGNRSLFAAQLLFCAPLGMAMATGVLTRLVDKWLVAWKIPLSLGAYTLAAQEIPILSVLPYASGAVVAVKLVTYFSAGDYIGAFAVWSDRVLAMCRPVAALTFFVVLVSPEIFSLFFGELYSSSVVPFQLFTLIGLHRVTEYGAVLRAAGKGSEVMTSSLLLLIFNIVFAGIGLYMQGIIGLTVGSLVAFLLAWLWMLGRVASAFHLSIGSVFPWSAWLRNVALFGAISLFIDAVSGVWGSSAAQLLVKVLLYASAYVFIRIYSHRHVHLKLTEISHATSSN